MVFIDCIKDIYYSYYSYQGHIDCETRLFQKRTILIIVIPTVILTPVVPRTSLLFHLFITQVEIERN